MIENSLQSNKYTVATVIAGVLSACAYAYLAINSQSYGDATLSQLWLISSLCAGLCFFLWLLHYRHNQTISIPLMLGFAVLFRVIGVFAFPVLEDDMYRYLWDGRMVIETGLPYSMAPAEFFTNNDLNTQFDSILGLINHPEIKTVYGPMNQWAFALAYLLAPGKIWPLQMIFALVDIALVLVLMRLAKPNNVLLYAWCPLVIKEFAFTAHPDVLGALFLMLAVLFFLKKKFIWVGAMIAFAAGVKIFAIILAPFLLKFKLRGWLALVITAALIALPFGIQQAWVPEGLIAMANDWLFNAPLYLILINWLPFDLVKLTLVLTFSLGAAAYFFIRWRNQSEAIPRGDYLFAALLLASPALNSWYLVLLLAFATIKPSFWAWTLSLSVLFSYGTGINLHDPSLQSYEIPYSILALEFGVVIFVTVLAYFVKRVIKQKNAKINNLSYRQKP